MTLFQRYIRSETLQSDWPTPFWSYMTEKQTNRFTDFTFELKDYREVRQKKAKNEFHHHGQVIAMCRQNKKSY